MARADDVEALRRVNDELLALSRARLPLTAELKRSAETLRGRAGELATTIGDRCEAGQSLSDALAAECPDLPDYYAAMVRAGESSGRMTAALESLADALGSVQRLRRVSWSSLAYPVAVALAAWVVALWGTSQLWPVYDWLGARRGDPHNAFESARRTAFAATLVGPPLVLVGGALLVRLRQRRLGEARSLLGWGALLPAVGAALRDEASASFCRLLGLQVANGAALHDALPLAADATGWSHYKGPARTLAGVLSNGGAIDDAPEARDALPAFAGPAIASGAGGEFLAESLAGAAQYYRERARVGVATAEKLAPVLAVTLVGGGAIACYAAVMLGPYLATLWTVTEWH